MIVENFLGHFRQGAADQCWEWGSARNPHGHGVYRGQCAHRVSYEHFVGPIPAGLVIDHLCFNPACVNPKHLEPVTRQENRRRAAERRCPWKINLPPPIRLPPTCTACGQAISARWRSGLCRDCKPRICKTCKGPRDPGYSYPGKGPEASGYFYANCPQCNRRHVKMSKQRHARQLSHSSPGNEHGLAT